MLVHDDYSNGGLCVKTMVEKGNIKKGEMVRAIHGGSFPKEFRNKNGEVQTYNASELIEFGILLYSNTLFDIIDTDGNKRSGDFRVKGLLHKTKNVMTIVRWAQLYKDFLFAGDTWLGQEPFENIIHFDYEPKELTDTEVIQILLDEILYGAEPGLQSVSMVGTTAKGIDKNPNYHDGHYHLVNGKNYTMTWCRGEVIIREGLDGGWYCGTKEPGREIYRGQIDWLRYKEALINSSTVRQLDKKELLLREHPEIQKILYNSIKDWDRFKLSSEFGE